MPNIFISADDFGLNSQIDEVILRAHACGTVSSTGVFATFERFQESAKLLRQTPSLEVGLHYNLTWGKGLTEGIQFRKPTHLLYMDLIGLLDGDLVYAEIEAQLLKCLDAALNVTHLTAHQHIVWIPTVRRAVEKLASKYQISYIRYSSEHSHSPYSRTFSLKRFFMKLFSKKHDSIGCFGVLGTGKLSFAALENALNCIGTDFELIAHPGKGPYLPIDKVGSAREKEATLLFDERVVELIHSKGYVVRRFDSLAKKV